MPSKPPRKPASRIGTVGQVFLFVMALGFLLYILAFSLLSKGGVQPATQTATNLFYTNATLIEDENGKLIQPGDTEYITVTARPGSEPSSFLPPGVYKVSNTTTSRFGHGWRLLPALSAKDQTPISVDDADLAREKEISVLVITRTVSPNYKEKKDEWSGSKKN